MHVHLENTPGDLMELHRLVSGQNRRIELSDGEGAVCVLIAKAELDAIEQALEILAKTETMQAMREQLQRVAAALDIK